MGDSNDSIYPPESQLLESIDPAYQDEAAAELYKVSDGGKLVGALQDFIRLRSWKNFTTPHIQKTTLD